MCVYMSIYIFVYNRDTERHRERGSAGEEEEEKR